MLYFTAILLFLAVSALAFKPNSMKRAVLSPFSVGEESNLNFLKVASIASIAVSPTQSAVADGTMAVAVPVAISIFTMVPFLYYQQALKPKERTVKQIELNDQLQAKNKSDRGGMFGKSTNAQAKKKK
jgi:hypothetical protein